jgi:hypothetical protein
VLPAGHRATIVAYSTRCRREQAHRDLSKDLATGVALGVATAGERRLERDPGSARGIEVAAGCLLDALPDLSARRVAGMTHGAGIDGGTAAVCILGEVCRHVERCSCRR